MKKILTIELVDGRNIVRDMTNERGLPVGAPANDTQYAMMCQAICMNGYTAPDTDIGPLKYRHLAPSQIKAVRFEFIKD